MDTSAPFPGGYNLERARQANGALVVKETDGLLVRTPPGRWQYAATISRGEAPACSGNARYPILIRLLVTVRAGRIGFGCLQVDTQFFLTEVEADSSAGARRVDILIDNFSRCGDLVIRNTSIDGDVSEVLVHSLETLPPDAAAEPYLVRVVGRNFPAEPTPSFSGGRAFDDNLATAINQARLEHLGTLGLPLAGKRVLDAGCGVGHLADFYHRQGCQVVGVDGRQENIDEMARRYPQIGGHVADVQSFDFSTLGLFDVVHCYGLLYHLDSPIAALRRLEQVCKEFMIIETMVCDSSRPVLVLVDEDKAANQALAGLASRPSPSFVAMALNRVGFPFVYGVRVPPKHDDFLVEWHDEMTYSRDGHNLRCVFVASRLALQNDQLISLIG